MSMKPRCSRRAFAAVFALFCTAGLANAQTYRVTDLGTLSPTDANSTAVRITDAGAVLGVSETSVTGSGRTAFALMPTGDAGAPYYYQNNCEVQNTLSMQTDAWARNVSGDLTGMLGWAQGGTGQAFVRVDTSLIMLGVLPQGTISAGLDLNSAHAVVGWSDTLDADGQVIYRGFYWMPESGMTSLAPLPGFAHSEAMGINDAALVVGRSTLVPYGADVSSRRPQLEAAPTLMGSRAVIWKAGTPVDLNTLCPNSGWTLLTATDINNHGQIVGCGINPQGQLRAYRLDLALQDFNADGVIDARDFTSFMQDFAVQRQTADLTGEGLVTIADASAFALGPVAPVLTEELRQWSDSGQEATASLVFLRGYEGFNSCGAPPFDSDDMRRWKSKPGWPNIYDPIFNPKCYGCSGTDAMNPARPNGQTGWPGSIPPPFSDWPYPNGNGGPGGNGAPGTPTNMPGNGGSGGDGAGPGQGGPGGRGGDGAGPLDGGAGGPGGHGGPESGPGGNGGPGGDSTGSGRGGGGGHGGDAGNGTGNKDGGAGGNGGPGGGGGTGGTGRGGNGGSGGSGGNGGPIGGNGGGGGTGAPGGAGGSGPGDNPGGSGGRGGNGGDGSAPGSNGGGGGKGGDGGPAGSPGVPVSSPGVGGDGGSGGKGKTPGGHGGSGGPPGSGVPNGSPGVGGGQGP